MERRTPTVETPVKTGPEADFRRTLYQIAEASRLVKFALQQPAAQQYDPLMRTYIALYTYGRILDYQKEVFETPTLSEKAKQDLFTEGSHVPWRGVVARNFLLPLIENNPTVQVLPVFRSKLAEAMCSENDVQDIETWADDLVQFALDETYQLESPRNATSKAEKRRIKADNKAQLEQSRQSLQQALVSIPEKAA